MAKRRVGSRSRRKGSGGGFLAAAVVALAVLVCFLVSPPAPEEVASVFSKHTRTAAPDVSAIVLPEQRYYLIIANGQAVAACGALLESEIIRETHGELASVEPMETEEITLRVTASRAQLDALREGADALNETFSLLEQMAHIAPADAATVARGMNASLSHIVDTLDKALAGTQNPVVRGLAGLVGSCREAMGDLEADATPERARKKLAGLLQQYSAYTVFLSGESARTT